MQDQSHLIQTMLQVIHDPEVSAKTRAEAQKKLAELIKSVKIYK